jgi:GT2 family glycosyltransferase
MPDRFHSIGVSVIIPTHGRVHLLRQLLKSLRTACQQYEGRSEILVVDSSSDQDHIGIEQACAESGATLHYMSNNVRMKRNWGIKHAQYPIVLFIDTDCKADANLLVEYARTYERSNSSVLGGVVGLTRFVGEENWVWRVIKRASTLDVFSYPEHHDVVPWGPTCNISYYREVIEEVGLFDTSFPFALGGDDTDLGIRVTDAGYRLVTNANAVVEHEKKTWSTVSLISKRLFRWGRMHFHIMQKHPHRVFVNPPTVPGVFLLLVLFFAPLGLVQQSTIWAAIPLMWLFLNLILDSLLISYKQGKQPMEFLYTLGSRILALIFQTGTVLEGIKNRSLAPLYKDASYCPPSPQSRRRGIAQMWAMVLAFPLTVLMLIIIQLVFRSI